MHKCILSFLLGIFFLTFGCKVSKQAEESEAAFSDNATYYERQRTPGLAYDDSTITQWAAFSYNPEGPSGIEGQTPPSFRDVSNLYGRMLGENTAASEMFLKNNAERKIVKRASIRIRVENLDMADYLVAGLMEKHGAYAASTTVKEYDYSYSIRVPSSAYNAFLAEMQDMGRILFRKESADDVTLRYYDLEGRLTTKKELLKTFQSYLGKAKNIEEILSVERKIAELQSELDATGNELRNLANDVDFSTIELMILGPASSTPYQDNTLPEQIKKLFSSFGSFLSSLAVILIGIVIYGIPILLLLFFFFWILFGKIGLLKKLWRAVTDRKQKPIKEN